LGALLGRFGNGCPKFQQPLTALEAEPKKEVEEVAPPVPVAKHPVATATLRDAVLSDTATHLVAKAKASEATFHSKIKTLAGYAMADIDLALLCKFCSLNKEKNANGKRCRHI
jgi:hypothetical protein